MEEIYLPSSSLGVSGRKTDEIADAERSQYKFVVVDHILNIGPIADICLGESFDAASASMTVCTAGLIGIIHMGAAGF
jgi:hypothetical protein